MWHLYLENVDPLLRLFQKPTLQKIVLDAGRDLNRIAKTTKTLLFAI